MWTSTVRVSTPPWHSHTVSGSQSRVRTLPEASMSVFNRSIRRPWAKTFETILRLFRPKAFLLHGESDRQNGAGRRQDHDPRHGPIPPRLRP